MKGKMGDNLVTVHLCIKKYLFAYFMTTYVPTTERQQDRNLRVYSHYVQPQMPLFHLDLQAL